MTDNSELSIYELSLNVRIRWEAHSLSNAGSNGSNRLMPRRQLLADGTETDACSGDIAKHYHAALLTEYFGHYQVPLCTACASHDSRRAGGLMDRAEYKGRETSRILQECGLCDTHGFLIPGKKANSGSGEEQRDKCAKHSLLDFSYALALPERQAETIQLTTRVGDSRGNGQMILKKSSRSGQYALCIRYKAVGVGVNTDSWTIAIEDQGQRRLRHRAILCALRDQVLSPEGALTATTMPHLAGTQGVIMIQTAPGRVPIYSPLESDFMARLQGLSRRTLLAKTFADINEFNDIMDGLIERSSPYLPVRHSTQRVSNEQPNGERQETQTDVSPSV